MRRIGSLLAVWLVVASAAFAQSEMPKPGPEQKKLEIFTGSWRLEGDMKPGPMGPGGKMTENEKCDWMEGGFFLTCKANYTSSMGNGSGFSVLGYSDEEKIFTYREFNSWGQFENSRGTVDGDTWTWNADEKMGSKTMKGRFTMKMTSATSYNFMYELSEDGTKWNSVMEGKATKNK